MHIIEITPNLIFEYQCTSGKFIRLPNRIEKNLFGSENRSESKLFCPNWNALPLRSIFADENESLLGPPASRRQGLFW